MREYLLFRGADLVVIIMKGFVLQLPSSFFSPPLLLLLGFT